MFYSPGPCRPPLFQASSHASFLGQGLCIPVPLSLQCLPGCIKASPPIPTELGRSVLQLSWWDVGVPQALPALKELSVPQVAPSVQAGGGSQPGAAEGALRTRSVAVVSLQLTA